MPAAECVVPLAGECRYRLAAWDWVRSRLPYPIRVGSCDGPWIKARAVTPAVEAGDAEIVVIHDADVWTPGLSDAVRAVQDGAGWAIPHHRVFRLTEDASELVMREGVTDVEKLELAQRMYRGYEGGGVVVLPRETFLRIPLDPRFAGWGGEDDSWGRALRTLLGSPQRVDAPLIHLWHPPQERMSRRWGTRESKDLARRYQRASGHPDQMRQLLEEFA